MKYISTHEIAERWNVTERTVRNYCMQGKIPGAFRQGKTWNVPDDAEKPTRSNNQTQKLSPLLARLKEEKAMQLKGGIYHRVQIELTYNSNHIEGSRLTLDQTRFIFETSTISLKAPNKPGEATETIVPVNDIIETTNHFRAIDYIIDHACDPLSESLIKHLHGILKSSTTDSMKSWFAVGDFKLQPNEVGMRATTPPEEVPSAIQALLKSYNSQSRYTLDDIVSFHVHFERIHPFQDGNGRVGRLIMFKECLKHNIVPFIITDDLKLFYYRGLSEWDNEKGYLMDTCLTAQDSFKKELDYFRIQY